VEAEVPVHSAGAADAIQRPALAAVEHLLVVVGVIEHAIADLAALHQGDAQNLSLGDDKGARLLLGNYELLDDPACHVYPLDPPHDNPIE
jgi:hypothetical protein